MAPQGHQAYPLATGLAESAVRRRRQQSVRPVLRAGRRPFASRCGEDAARGEWPRLLCMDSYVGVLPGLPTNRTSRIRE